MVARLSLLVGVGYREVQCKSDILFAFAFLAVSIASFISFIFAIPVDIRMCRFFFAIYLMMGRQVNRLDEILNAEGLSSLTQSIVLKSPAVVKGSTPSFLAILNRLPVSFFVSRALRNIL